MGVFALGITGVSFEQYNITFGHYLNTALHGAGECLINTIPLYATTTLYDGLDKGTLDFTFIEPGTYACLVVSFAPRELVISSH